MPKLSIVTINYNNEQGLQKTFKSVFEQSMQAFEYIVIDGGSADGSKELIEKHAHKIYYWVSEKDAGVYNAMNKGIQKATGDYILFLNSGDHFFNSDILKEVNETLDGTGIVYGNIQLVESVTKFWIGYYPCRLDFQFFVEGTLPHCASFIKRILFNQVGFYDEGLSICADWKFFIDAVCRYNVSYKLVEKTIATFYLDGLSSTGDSAAIIQKEKESVLQSDYPFFMELYREVILLRNFRKNKFINAFANIAKRLGILTTDTQK